MTESNDEKVYNKLLPIIDAFVQNARQELYARWKNWDIDLSKPEQFEVIGGLLARQVTLATQLASAPSIWNGHIAPIILRSMVDNYINFTWIIENPKERAIKYVEYGLGQEKLGIEHMKEKLESLKDGEEKETLKNKIMYSEEWLESQKFAFLTEVNVGAWSGKSTREMAEDTGLKKIYDFSYKPLSAVAHNMWHHIARFNLAHCDNPLHRYHRIPIDQDQEIDLGCLIGAAMYLDLVFQLFEEKTGVKVKEPSAIEILFEDMKVFK